MNKLTAFAALLVSAPVYAQNPPVNPPPNPPSGGAAPSAAASVPAKWNVNEKRAASKDVDYEVSEGTWMSLDISPDGRTVVFDLVGDIYTMPVSGGAATLIHNFYIDRNSMDNIVSVK